MGGLAREFYASSKMLREFNLVKFIELWTIFLVQGTGVIFLLMDGGAITGTIGGIVYPEAYSGELTAQEFFWFVHQKNRGGGVRLYRAFEQWALKKGCHEVRMGYLVDLMPEKVAHFYERLGFTRVEVNYAKRLDVVECRKAG